MLWCSNGHVIYLENFQIPSQIWIIRQLVHYLATDPCRDGWKVRNCSSSHVQVFRDRWNVQIGDGWNVRNCLNMNFLKFVKNWILILQNLCSLSCKSTNFVLVIKTHVDVVVLVVWVVFVWFVVCYVWFIKLGCIRRRCGMNIFNFGLSPLCLVYMKFLIAKVLELGCKRCIDWKQSVKIFLS